MGTGTPVASNAPLLTEAFDIYPSEQDAVSSVPIPCWYELRHPLGQRRGLVQGAHRVLRYRPRYDLSSVAPQILGITKGCEVESCADQAVTYVPICTQPCRCREWLCAKHAGQVG